jgi:CBS domain containing-hemolysin-like protein
VTPLAVAGFHSEDLALVIVIVVLLAASGMLALAETSLVRMNRIKAKAMVDEKRRGARQLARLIEHPAQFLNPILLLVLICQLVSATLVGVVAEHLLGGIGVLVGAAFEVVVIFVFFEAVPKNWAVHNPERAALLSAPVVSAVVRFPPIRFVSSLLIGLANLIIGQSGGGEDGLRPSYITDSELKAMADVAHEENVIEHEERTFIHSVIDFGDTVAREVMVPRPDMVTIESERSVTEALETALAAGFSRIPVHEGQIDDITGIAYTKDLMRDERAGKGEHPVREAARPPVFVPESKGVPALLHQMQEEKFHMAIVVDEYGGTAGLVTLEDLLEELVGEIVDEFDVEEPGVERHPDGSVVVSARYAVDDADDLLGADLPQGPWDTVGGLMLDLAGRVPDEGDSVEVDGFRLTALDVRGRRIGRVRIAPTARVPALDDEER